MYGDPKLGGASLTTVVATAGEPAGEPPTAIAVTVPNYTVEEYDGYHHVTIPGGEMLHEPGHPVVPIFTRDLPLPAGYRVQEVTLTSRSAPVTSTGLKVFDKADQPVSTGATATPPAIPAGPWPQTPFRWEVEEQSHSTGLLRIHIYPFVYNAATGQADFYKEYNFAVSYTLSDVEIHLADRSPVGYGTGEEIAATLWVVNKGQPTDMVVSATIRPDKPDGEDQVQGLLLQMLEGVQDLASFPLRWETDGLATGHYLIEAEVRDPSGDLLDSTVTTVQLGAVSAVAENLLAAPDQIRSGEPMSISFGFRNTGAVPISGTAMIQVLSLVTGEILAAFEQPVGPVVPGASATIQATWTTPSAAPGAYRINAYVLYDARATEPLSASVRVGWARFLPLIVKR
jgi:hypothetical protein